MKIRTPTRRPRLLSVATLVVLSLSLFALPGCGTLDRMMSWVGLSDDAAPDTPDALVMRAMDAFNYGKYSDALKLFEDLRDRYPFSRYSLLADLKVADCQFFMDEYAAARPLYEEFESNHPTNEAIPYVMFQIGMCYYHQIGTIDRDTSGAVSAIQAFSRLVRTYPTSPYQSEAQARIKAARDFLARHEMYVAAFYVRTEEYSQAQGRLEYLLATYPEATVSPKANELLAAIKSGNAPQRSWKDWIPDISLPDWATFAGGLSVQKGPMGASSGGE